MILKKIVGVSGIGSLFSSSLSCPIRDGEETLLDPLN